MHETELVLDVGRWRGKTPEEITEDVASAGLEFSRNTNIYWVRLGKDGNLYHPKFKKPIKELSRRDHLVYEREYQALIKAEKWIASNGPRNCVLIGPQHPDFYPSTRFIFMRKFSEDERTVTVCRAICTTHTGQECLQIARQISRFSPKAYDLNNPEDLRQTALEFDLPENTELLDFIAQSLTSQFPDIRRGKDFENKLAALETAREIVLPKYQQIQEAASSDSQIDIGADIERDMEERGYPTERFRDCPGITNRQAQNRKSGAFNLLYSNREATLALFCGMCGWFLGKWIRPGFECPHCREIFLGICK